MKATTLGYLNNARVNPESQKPEPVVDPWRQLMIAIILQTVEDARRGDRDARLFFLSWDWPLWAEALNLPDAPMVFRNGRAYQVPRFVRVDYDEVTSWRTATP